MSQLGQALTELGTKGLGTEGLKDRDRGAEGTRDQEDGPAVHALFVYNSNPGAVAPNHNAVRRGLERDDLFTVVHELFFTDTTDYADFILPATTFLEHTDVQGAYGHYFVQLSKQAIEPLGEARSNVWLFGQLAQRMGFTEPCFRDTPEEMIRQALGHRRRRPLDERRHGAHHAGRTGARRPHPARASSPTGSALIPLDRVPTPSGKIEFFSEALAAAGLDGASGIHRSR